MAFIHTRRRLAVVLAAALGVGLAAPAGAATYDLTIDPVTIDTGEFRRDGVGFNGASPGPVLRFREGEDVTINVTNNLDESSSIHWHGLILPYRMDGVPGISYDGIAPGETFTYRFPVTQAGTYWFHSHSGFQEPDGAYGAIVIEPRSREPFRFDREHVVVLTDAHPHRGSRVMRNLKRMPDYYNRQQRTLLEFFDDAGRDGLGETVSDRLAWGSMRMMAADVEDLQGYTALINGQSPTANWTGLFEPGERVRLRLINASAMTYFDVRIPGLEMTVVQADGNNVQPVTVDELRIAVAETYDVLVQPTEERAYTVFAESMGRAGYARGTLAPRAGMSAPVPELRDAPRLTMADMGMSHGDGGHGAMDHDGMSEGGPAEAAMAHGSGAMAHGAEGEAMAGPHGGHEAAVTPDTGMQAGMSHGEGTMPASSMPAAGSGHEGMMPGDDDDHHGAGDHAAAGDPAAEADPFYAPGSGLMPAAANGGRFLSYADLRAQKPLYADRPPTREIELRLTGNMERYIWSIDGVKYEDADPIRLRYGERVRFKFVNTTMMTHPMHLHGMWSILDVGAGKWNPVKHVVSVAPGTTVYMETEVDAPGEWAFHCHLSYHADSGMFRKVVVEGGPQVADAGGAN